MPTVQYVYSGEIMTRQMPTPKSISKVYSWFKGARKVIPSIPVATIDVFGDNEWMIEHHETDVKWVKFELLSKRSERAVLVILR